MKSDSSTTQVVNTQATTQVPQTGSDANGSTWGAFLPFILIFVLFYFLIIRPQQKREAQKREQLNKIKPGDYVVTNGGIQAIVTKVIDDKKVLLEIAPKVEVEFYKSFVTNVIDRKELKKKMQNGLSKTVTKKDKQQNSEASSEGTEANTDKTVVTTEEAASASDNTETFTEKKE